jgi:beta-glucosidase
MRKTVFCATTALAIGGSCQQAEQPSGAREPVEARVDGLLSQMTLKEKIGQLNMYNGTWDFTGPVPEQADAQEREDQIRSGGVSAMLNVLTPEAICAAQRMAVEESRLGIPMLFGYDVIHGYKTMMPIPLGQASSWDPTVAERANRVAAAEATSEGLSLAFGPMVDITPDARWGRIMEGAGEDPFLAARMAEGWVKGFQGADLSERHSIAACAKHFAGYGFAEAGKEYNTTDMSDQTLLNVVLPTFRAAVDAGCAAIMNGFNDLNGVPVTADAYIQRTQLKEAWGFDGFVLSDFNSVPELVTHGYSPDMPEAGKAAFLAGSDMEMESRLYERHLLDQVRSGVVSEELIDDAVRRVLRIKFRLGLFENPYKYCEAKGIEIMSKAHLQEARELARESMVLLKNEAATLPLQKDASIVVIGSLAQSKDVPLGNWRAQAVENSAVSLLEGIRAAAGSKVEFAEGYRISLGRRSFIFDMEWADASEKGFEEAIQVARRSDVVVMALGEDCYQTGEGRSQTDVGLKGDQLELFHAVRAVNPNVVVVLMNGRPLAIPDIQQHASAILESWHAGSQAGYAIADILFGDHNPSGKLPVSFPHHTGQEPLYYNHKKTGRPVTNDFDKGLVFWAHYSDAPVEALYPFGYGLSYSRFIYSDLEINDSILRSGADLEVRVRLTNDSEIAGEEVVQLYIRDPYGSLTRPVKELKAFRKIHLKAGESQLVSFRLSEDDLAYHWSRERFEAEPGRFELYIGGNSHEVLQTAFTFR